VATQVTMPMLGLTMEEGTVAEWLKQEGDAVRKDEPLLLVEMDKGTQEVPSPAAGILRRIVVQPGITVPIKTLLAEIGEPGEVVSAPAAPSSGSSPAAGGSTDESPAGGPGDLPGTSNAGAGAASGAGGGASAVQSFNSGAAVSAVASGARQFSSPRARMRARALGVDLGAIRGSGPHGRIVEADVLSAGPAVETRVPITPLARRLAEEHGVQLGDIQGSGPGGRITQDDVLRVAAQRPATAASAPGEAAEAPRESQPAPAGVQPLTRVRRITAERMAISAQATARVTLFLDADFSEAARFKDQLQPEFARLGTPKLPWDALIAKAAALALGEHRAVLSQWVDATPGGLRQLDAVHVGVAVALQPEGLVVPVLRDAGTRSLRELASDLLALADKARAGRLSPAEMQGGAFTITNLGAYRIDGFTPIINPPETAILGVGRIAPKAVVIDGKVEARTMGTLSLSFDHRVVDGAPAAAFLARLAELLERPYTLLGI
jgi:pyruvate dehydrogenase E2 component (dihydrolipoamide acetyltransferase)